MDKHDTLLIACGESENRRHLREVLEERYNLLEATNFQQAVLLLRQNVECVAAVVTDITIRKKLVQEMQENQDVSEFLEQFPVIIMSGEDSPELLNQLFGEGAADVIPMDYEPYAMLRRIETIVELHLHKQYLETMVQEQADLLRHSNDTIVDALSSIIEYRSVESGQHILRIRHFTKILLEEVARCCPEYGLTERSIAIIASAAALHDIGKIAIPDSILMKPGKLTPEERQVMQTHSLTGCRILDSLSNVADREYLRYAHNICHYHHERWDGKGYPEGLSGEEIPICAQVVGLADVYDALTAKRVYKEAYSFAQTVNMILKGECGIFSPKLLECFKHVTQQYEKLAREYADGLSPQNESFDTTLPAPVAQENNTMDRTRAKYFALVHYINAFLIELDMSNGLFHVVYNPYPQLAQFQNVSTFEQLEQMVLDRVVVAEDRERMYRFIHRDIPDFLEEDLRRVTYHFRFQTKGSSRGSRFEVTLLRINPIDASRKSLAVLCRQLGGNEDTDNSRNMVYTLAESTYVCRNDRDFTLVEVGNETYELAGYSLREIREEMGGGLIALVHPEDRKLVRSEFTRQLRSGTGVKLEYRVQNKDGSVRWVMNKSRLVVDTDGQEYLYSFLTDVSHTRVAYDAMKDKLHRYEIILAQTENVLFEWDIAADQVTFSETWEKIFGFMPMDKSLRDQLAEGSHFHPDDLPLLFDRIGHLENGSDYETVEVRIATDRGRYRWCRFRASAIRDKQGNLQKVAGIIINIDTEKQAQRMLQDRAERDSLTRLLNKTAGRKQAEEYLARYPKGVSCALLIIDLDNFKTVNDRYGHLFGDSVLTQAAREIEKLFRTQDIVSRIGGDEFLVLMRGVSDRKILEGRCQRLLNIFASTFRSQKYKLPLGCSIGIALAPEHGTTYYELFNHADTALYRAKAMGKNNFCFYDRTEDNFPALQKQATAVNNHIDSDEEPGLAEDNIVRYAFQRLYTSRNIKESVNEILALVGKKMNVSRVYVFENSDDNRFCSNTYEWCNEGIEPQIDNLQNISYETDIPDYEDNFDEQGIFYCPDVTVLPKKTYDIVEPQGIKSMLHCAIREGGVFRGYIGFDECVEQRLWTKEQIRMLTFFSETLSLFLLKQREHQKALSQAQELHSILDNQSAWIYIIDPDNFELKYLNEKARKMTIDKGCGGLCYQVLMGRTQRCPGCPAEKIREKKNGCAVLTDGKYPLEILAEATLVQWQGSEACLMTCRKLPGQEPENVTSF